MDIIITNRGHIISPQQKLNNEKHIGFLKRNTQGSLWVIFQNAISKTKIKYMDSKQEKHIGFLKHNIQGSLRIIFKNTYPRLKINNKDS